MYVAFFTYMCVQSHSDTYNYLQMDINVANSIYMWRAYKSWASTHVSVYI